MAGLAVCSHTRCVSKVCAAAAAAATCCCRHAAGFRQAFAVAVVQCAGAEDVAADMQQADCTAFFVCTISSTACACRSPLCCQSTFVPLLACSFQVGKLPVLRPGGELAYVWG